MKRIWFGTKRFAEWVACPAIDMGMPKVGWSSQTFYINGGASSRNSRTTHKEYNMSWNQTSKANVEKITNFAAGVYGEELIFWSDPFASPVNGLTEHWAHPAKQGYDAPILDGSTIRPKIVDTPTTLNWVSRLPTSSVVYTNLGYNNVRKPKMFVPVPPGFEVHYNFVGSATEGAPYINIDHYSNNIVTGGTKINFKTPVGQLGVISDPTISGVELSLVNLGVGEGEEVTYNLATNPTFGANIEDTETIFQGGVFTRLWARGQIVRAHVANALQGTVVGTTHEDTKMGLYNQPVTVGETYSASFDFTATVGAQNVVPQIVFYNANTVPPLITFAQFNADTGPVLFNTFNIGWQGETFNDFNAWHEAREVNKFSDIKATFSGVVEPVTEGGTVSVRIEGVVAPAGSTHMAVVAQNPAGFQDGSVIFLNNFQINNGGVVLPYSDGDTENHEWLGVPQNSPSRGVEQIGGELTLAALMLAVVPTGSKPPPVGGEDWHTSFHNGQGAAGCRFVGYPAEVGYSAALDLVGLTAKLVEVGPWE